MQWANDGYGRQSHGQGRIRRQADVLCFLTVNYTAGHSIRHDAQKVIQAGGGKFWAPPAFRSTHPTSARFCCRRRTRRQEHRFHWRWRRRDGTSSSRPRIRHRKGWASASFHSPDDGRHRGARQQADAEGMPLVLSYYWDKVRTRPRPGPSVSRRHSASCL